MRFIMIFCMLALFSLLLVAQENLDLTVSDENTEKEDVTEPVVKKSVAPEKEEKAPQTVAEPVAKPAEKFLSASLKADVTVPSSKVNTTWAIHGEVRYILPFWNPHLSFGLDVGFYPLSGKGQNIDNQAGLYNYEWSINSLPVNIGPAVEYPMTMIKWLVISAEGGFSMLPAWSEGKSFNGRTEQSDIAYGFYAGAGAELRLGVFGGAVVQYRYTKILLDFAYPEFNEKLGDLGGSSVLIGYKYLF